MIGEHISYLQAGGEKRHKKGPSGAAVTKLLPPLFQMGFQACPSHASFPFRANATSTKIGDAWISTDRCRNQLSLVVEELQGCWDLNLCSHQVARSSWHRAPRPCPRSHLPACLPCSVWSSAVQTPNCLPAAEFSPLFTEPFEAK